MGKVNDVIEKLKGMGSERFTLLGELEHSLMIESIFPGAFDHGRCSVSWRWIEDGEYHHAAMIITRGDDHEIMFALEDVPSKMLKSEMERRGFNGNYLHDAKVDGHNMRINQAIISRCKRGDVKNETTLADKRMEEI
jgi:hypothetical protein